MLTGDSAVNRHLGALSFLRCLLWFAFYTICICSGDMGDDADDHEGSQPFRYRFFANMHGKRLRPRRGGRGWVVEWGPLWSPASLSMEGRRAATSGPTLPLPHPTHTDTRG